MSKVEEYRKQLATPVKDVILKAKKLLIDKGWCVDTQIDGFGRHCIVGALQTARFGKPFTGLYDEVSEYKLLESLISRRTNEKPGFSLAHWNNNQTDSKPVIALLDKALEVLDAKE